MALASAPISLAIPKPIFMERKAINLQQPKTPVYLGVSVKSSSSWKRPTKITQTKSIEDEEELLKNLKPARNTGFDPNSIVIEGGFKPIIRKNVKWNRVVREEPKNRRKLELVAAEDRRIPFYLPPPSGGLVSYDGKKIRNLEIKALPQTASSRISAVELARTPQFGRFNGDLPPPVPADVHSTDAVQLQLGSTKLLRLDRPRRSTSKKNNDVTESSAAQDVLSNIQYIILTAILYFAM